ASFVGTSSIDTTVDVIASAQRGSLYLNGDHAAGADGTLLSSVTLRIRGVDGVRELSFLSATSYSEIVSAINSNTELTGVRAELINGNPLSGIVFSSVDYGSKSFV